MPQCNGAARGFLIRFPSPPARHLYPSSGHPNRGR